MPTFESRREADREATRPLFETYGRLLSADQQSSLERYLGGLSIPDIARVEGVSRQGAFEKVRTAQQRLAHYEEVLGLIKRDKMSGNDRKARARAATSKLRAVAAEIRKIAPKSKVAPALEDLESAVAELELVLG